MVCSRSSLGDPETDAPLAADGIDFVNEDDAGCAALAFVEQIADAARANADEHLDELRARNAEERHAALARHRAGQQRLASAGRANQQDTPLEGVPRSDELLWLLQELDDLL